jgi:hypothetical protein
MPPSPAVDIYISYGEVGPGYMDYYCQFYLMPWVKDWAKMLEPWQLSHRSRVAAIASAKLQTNEIEHRLNQSLELEKVLQKDAVSMRESSEIYHLLLDETESHMKYNISYIMSYIKDHQSSSMGEGYKWIDMYMMDEDFWEWHFNTEMDNISYLRAHEGEYSQNTMRNGIRARSQNYGNLISRIFGRPEVVNDTEYLDGYMDGDSIVVTGRKTRDRMVRFGPSHSQFTVHLAQKASWYRRVLRGVIDILDAQPEFVFPYEIGGQVYVLAADLLSAGYYMECVDGSSWDSSVGTLIGPSFGPLLSYFHRPTDPRGFLFLDSGITFTSMLGTIANVISNRHERGTIIALGDDMTHFTTKKGGSIAKPYAEVELLDTKYQYMLGVSYFTDPQLPRLTGMKTTMDRAGAMQPLRTVQSLDKEFEQFSTRMDRGSYNKDFESAHGRKRSKESSAAWAGAYFGQFGKRSLIDALKSVPPGEYIAPTQLIEEILIEQIPIDPFSWAEEQGIKTLFL